MTSQRKMKHVTVRRSPGEFWCRRSGSGIGLSSGGAKGRRWGK